MDKGEAANELYFELMEVQRAICKASIASRQLYEFYFCCIKKGDVLLERFDDAAYLSDIVTDYTKQCCELLEELQNIPPTADQSNEGETKNNFSIKEGVPNCQ